MFFLMTFIIPFLPLQAPPPALQAPVISEIKTSPAINRLENEYRTMLAVRRSA